MIVIPYAESLLDKIANHWTSPDSARVSSLLGAIFNDLHQLGALLFCKLSVRPRWYVGQEPICTIGLVSLEPAIHRTTCDVCFLCELDHPSAFHIAQNGSPSSPPIKVPSLEAFLDEPHKPSARRPGPARRTDRTSYFRTFSIRCWHNRARVISSGSYVNIKPGQAATKRLLLADEPRHTSDESVAELGARRFQR